MGVRKSSPEKMLSSLALRSGHASSAVIPCKPILEPRLVKAEAVIVGVCSRVGKENIEALLGGPSMEFESKLLGPKKSLLESSRNKVPLEPLLMT